jgi:hypothetical protein
MLRYSLKRLLSLAISLIIASLVIFLVIEVAPGDPASFMLGINAQEDTLNALREELGLNQSKLEILVRPTPTGRPLRIWCKIGFGYRCRWRFTRSHSPH